MRGKLQKWFDEQQLDLIAWRKEHYYNLWKGFNDAIAYATEFKKCPLIEMDNWFLSDYVQGRFDCKFCGDKCIGKKALYQIYEEHIKKIKKEWAGLQYLFAARGCIFNGSKMKIPEDYEQHKDDWQKLSKKELKAKIKASGL